jgi:hypothetical protein
MVTSPQAFLPTTAGGGTVETLVWGKSTAVLHLSWAGCACSRVGALTFLSFLMKR